MRGASKMWSDTSKIPSHTTVSRVKKNSDLENGKKYRICLHKFFALVIHEQWKLKCTTKISPVRWGVEGARYYSQNYSRIIIASLCLRLLFSENSQLFYS